MGVDRPSDIYIQWVPEGDDQGSTSGLWGAWLVHDLVDDLGTRTQFLAYLGTRPQVSPELQEEFAVIYPHLEVDWESIRRALEYSVPQTDVAALSDDDVALRFRELAREQGLSVPDLALRIHMVPRNVLQETETLVQPDENRERFTRQAGSIFAYLAEKHPEYAYGLLKVRLLLEGKHDVLRRLVQHEPQGFDPRAARARRNHWAAALVSHLGAERDCSD